MLAAFMSIRNILAAVIRNFNRAAAIHSINALPLAYPGKSHNYRARTFDKRTKGKRDRSLQSRANRRKVSR